MEWFFWVPLVLGALWGAWQGRRDRFSFAVLRTAPILSAALIVGVVLAVSIFNGPAHVNQKPLADRVVMWLAAAVVWGFGAFLVGAVPARVSSAAAQLCKLWVARGYSANQRSERGNIQREPNAAADRPRD